MAHRYQRPIAQTNPRSLISEAYRTVRTNIQYATVVQDTQTILVTSSQAGEGKTYTATNLAVVTAQTGKRVLIIDGDLRKPQLHYVFGVSNVTGLSSVLIRESELAESIATTETPNLFVLPCGPLPHNPSEMLSSQAFVQLVDTCRSQFDVIIIDSPPILVVTDAVVLTRVADGTVLVVDAQKSNRHFVQKAITALDMVGTRILGTVLNRQTRGKSVAAHQYYMEVSKPIST